MKILFAAAEAVPFCKTGGLADVAGALPPALRKKRHDVRLILPKYRRVDAGRFGLKPLNLHLTLPMGDGYEKAALWEGRTEGRVPVYFVDCPKYFDRDGLYGDASGDYPDNDERFILFSRAVLEAAKAVDFRPDVVHCHDWQTGLVPAYLRTLYAIDGFFIPTAGLFTIHNIAYQGLFPKNALFLAGFSWADFTPDKLEFYGRMNFLKAGLVFSHLVNTVSPGYAEETRTDPSLGGGLEGILKLRGADYSGVLNGIDTRLWNPARDPHLARKFSAKRPEPRADCKRDLQQACGLDADPSAFLAAAVSRLDPQKGFDLILEAAEDFLADGGQLAVLGQGDPALEEELKALAEKRPGRASFFSGFNDPLAHKMYGGADVFLMPSRFEPCGLGQLIAMRYGAVPVVTPTGGLKDTVRPYGGPDATGFVTAGVSAEALAESLRRAASVHGGSPEAWRRLMANGMSGSYGWDRSVDDYLRLYQEATAKKAAEPA
jgi:starch synthase